MSALCHKRTLQHTPSGVGFIPKIKNGYSYPVVISRSKV